MNDPYVEHIKAQLVSSPNTDPEDAEAFEELEEEHDAYLDDQAYWRSGK